MKGGRATAPNVPATLLKSKSAFQPGVPSLPGGGTPFLFPGPPGWCSEWFLYRSFRRGNDARNRKKPNRFWALETVKGPGRTDVQIKTRTANARASGVFKESFFSWENTSRSHPSSDTSVLFGWVASFLEALCCHSCMPAIVLESVPEALHRRLKRAAAAHRRSLTQEAIVLLEAALAQQEARAQNPEPYFARRVLLP